MEFSKVEPRNWYCEVQELGLSCYGCEGLDGDPTLVLGCSTQKVLGEHGDVVEFLDGGSEDALLEVHFHAHVFAHLGGCVVARGGVYAEAETVHEGEGLVLAAHGFVETVREDVEVVHEGEKQGSRAQASSEKPLLFHFCR